MTTQRRHGLRARLPLIAGSVAVALAVTGLTSGCGTSGAGSFASQSKGGNTSVSLLQQPWDDLDAENMIAKQLLGKLGYQVHIKKLSVAVGAKSLETGKIDGYLGNWWPSQKPDLGKIISSGKVKVLGNLATGTQYAPAIPGKFAKKLHIDSLAQLDKHGAAFGHKIYGIESGTPGDKTIKKMIHNNDYGLGDWKLVPSSTPAMLSQAKRAVKRDQPIVFLGWSPHWMVSQFHLAFLKDPKGVWGQAGRIRTVVNTDFSKKNPNVTKFLGNLTFSVAEAGQFYVLHDKQHQSYSKIARDWIKAHPQKVTKFVDGVKSVKGKPATSVVSGS
jgi:glycine betaine/proline transport system substrate-binding protein